MGMEVMDEFRPLTPLRLTPSLQIPKERRDFQEQQPEECQTPTAAGSRLKPTMECPPAPKKPRPPRRKLNFQPPSFFDAPQDLKSVYFELQFPSKKIKPIST
ncbi:hypothetical protein SDJN03_16285, partial [Cucurbita argyrosperma subsp. sororia]